MKLWKNETRSKLYMRKIDFKNNIGGLHVTSRHHVRGQIQKNILSKPLLTPPEVVGHIIS